jgi:uncharacterized membrane protein YeaQ/YmgE (transglycosylase-associated protein family)
MTVVEILLLLLVAGICGSLARGLVGYTRGGCLLSIVLGFIGALLGSWISRQAGMPELFTIQLGENEFPVVWSIIGAALFVAVLALLSGRRRSI